MAEIVQNVVNKLNKNATFTQIKETLKSECNNVTFEINRNDWIEMLNDVLVELNKGE